MKSVGIDYHKRYSVVCIVEESGVIVAEERIEHVYPERFGALLGEHAPCQVGFEATMNWGWLHEILEEIESVERIVMANPLHVRLISAAQVKTDKVDARKLAQLLRAGLLPASHIPDRATRQRKEVLRQRTFWVRERTKVRNRIHRLLGRQHGLEMPQVSDLFGKKGRAALAKVTLSSPEAASEHAGPVGCADPGTGRSHRSRRSERFGRRTTLDDSGAGSDLGQRDRHGDRRHRAV